MSESKIFIMDDTLYRIEDKSEYRGQVIVRNVDTDKRMILSTKKWRRDSRRAYTMGETADILNMHKKSLVSWLSWLEFPVYEIVYQTDVDNPISSVRSTKYLSREDIIQIYDMLIRLRQNGKPSKDQFREPKYDMPTRPELLAALNDSDVYYMKKDGEYVPVFRPEWV